MFSKPCQVSEILGAVGDVINFALISSGWWIEWCSLFPHETGILCSYGKWVFFSLFKTKKNPYKIIHGFNAPLRYCLYLKTSVTKQMLLGRGKKSLYWVVTQSMRKSPQSNGAVNKWVDISNECYSGHSHAKHRWALALLFLWPLSLCPHLNFTPKWYIHTLTS